MDVYFICLFTIAIHFGYYFSGKFKFLWSGQLLFKLIEISRVILMIYERRKMWDKSIIYLFLIGRISELISQLLFNFNCFSDTNWLVLGFGLSMRGMLLEVEQSYERPGLAGAILSLLSYPLE